MSHLGGTMWHWAVVATEWMRETLFNSLVAAGCSGMGVGITAPRTVSDGPCAVRLTARERVAWRRLEERLSHQMWVQDSGHRP